MGLSLVLKFDFPKLRLPARILFELSVMSFPLGFYLCVSLTPPVRFLLFPSPVVCHFVLLYVA